MDFDPEAGFIGSNIVPEPSDSGGFDNWVPGLNDQAIWATEDDYRAWNVDTPSNSNYDGRPQSQSRAGSEPPNKRSRTAQGGSDLIVVGTSSNNNGSGSNRSKAIGKMFFKTKLCCKFRAGVCPYITNCNFAHGIEELRRPPPNWQEIVAAHEEERSVMMVEPIPREEHAIPTFTSSDMRVESQRSYKGRHCKKFYTEEGCPYGDNCTFLHDEQSRARESVAISLSPSVGGSSNVLGNGGNGVSQKPSNWKTRICNKWETTGSCPFGSKCHFAHGLQELHKYGGGLLEMEARDSSSAASDLKQGGVSSKSPTDTVVASSLSTPHVDNLYHMGGVPSQRPSIVAQRPNQRPHQKWKGPDKISRIYGDWIDDFE